MAATVDLSHRPPRPGQESPARVPSSVPWKPTPIASVPTIPPSPESWQTVYTNPVQALAGDEASPANRFSDSPFSGFLGSAPITDSGNYVVLGIIAIAVFWYLKKGK